MIKHEKLKIITQTNLAYTRDHKVLSLCKEFVHGVLSTQHFITNQLPNHSYLLFYVVKGQGVVYTQGELKGLKQKDLCLIDSSTSFYISSNDWEFIYLYLEGETIHSIIKDYFTEKLFSIKDPQYIEKQFYYLNDYMKKAEMLMVSSSVQKLIFDLVKSREQTQIINNHQTPIETAKKYIENQFTQELSIEFLSQSIGFSKFHFIRLFKEVTGTTPYHYLLQVRLDHAQFLLRTTKNSISEIAALCGFKSEMNFYQNFVKYTGLPPSRYRQL